MFIAILNDAFASVEKPEVSWSIKSVLKKLVAALTPPKRAKKRKASFGRLKNPEILEKEKPTEEEYRNALPEDASSAEIKELKNIHQQLWKLYGQPVKELPKQEDDTTIELDTIINNRRSGAQEIEEENLEMESLRTQINEINMKLESILNLVQAQGRDKSPRPQKR